MFLVCDEYSGDNCGKCKTDDKCVGYFMYGRAQFYGCKCPEPEVCYGADEGPILPGYQGDVGRAGICKKISEEELENIKGVYS